MAVVVFESKGDIGTTLLPQRHDITVYQGDTFRFNMVFNGTEDAIDITGWTGKCQVRGTDGAVVTEANITLTDPEAGTLEVDFGDTGQVPGGEYKYDIEMTDTGGGKRTYIGGKFIVLEDITE